MVEAVDEHGQTELEVQFYAMLAAGAKLVVDDRERLEAKAYVSPPQKEQLIINLLHCYLNNVAGEGVTWQTLRRGVLAQPISFANVDIDNLSARQKQIVVQASAMDFTGYNKAGDFFGNVNGFFI